MTERLFETVVRLFLASVCFWRAGPAGAGVYKHLHLGEVTDCPLVLGWGWPAGCSARWLERATGQVQVQVHVHMGATQNHRAD